MAGRKKIISLFANKLDAIVENDCKSTTVTTSHIIRKSKNKETNNIA